MRWIRTIIALGIGPLFMLGLLLLYTFVKPDNPFDADPLAPDHEKPRYVVLSPEIAEILALVDGTENIVGVADQCDYPPELQQIAKTGGFGHIQTEKILNLLPDRVFTAGIEQATIADGFAKAGIPVSTFQPDTVDSLLATIRHIGRLTGRTGRAEQLADSLEQQLERVRWKGAKRVPVYVEIYPEPIMSVSDASFVGQLVWLAGGRNVFSGLSRPYARVDAGAVIEAAPEVILLTYEGVFAEDIAARMGWSVIPAVHHDRVYTPQDLDPDLILRAGPRIVSGLVRLHRLIHGNQGNQKR